MTSICLALLAGQAMAIQLHSRTSAIPLVLSILAFLMAVVAWRRSTFRWRAWIALLASVGLMGLAMGAHELERIEGHGALPGSDDGAEVICDGVVLADPVARSEGFRYDMQLHACRRLTEEAWQRHTGVIRLFVRGRPEMFEAGDLVRFQGRLSRPRDFRNPGGFSYRLHLASRGIAGVGSIGDARMMAKIEDAHGDDIDTAIWRLRRTVVHSIDASIEDPEAAMLLKEFTVGVRHASEERLRDDFAATGLAHLLSISGFHVGALAAASMLVLAFGLRLFPRLFLTVPRPQLIAIGALPLIWWYVLLAGMPVPAVRAAIMLTAVLAASALRRRPDALSGLAFAVLLITAASPLAVADVSFQLSVSAMLGMIVFVPRLLRSWQGPRLPERRGIRWCLQPVAVTIAATLATAPIILFHFHRLSPVGLLANLIAVPIAGIITIPPALLAMGCALIAPEWAGLLWQGAGWGCDLLIGIAQWFSPLAERLSYWAAPTLMAAAAAVVAIFLVMARQRWLRASGLALLLLVLLEMHYGVRNLISLIRPRLEVTHFDVGQGDAALVRFPDQTSWLIDGGGLRGSDFDVGQQVIAPALWQLGIRELDAVVLSHPHYDHYGGLPFMIERFSPSVFFMSQAEIPADELDLWERFSSRLEAQGVPVHLLSAETPSWQQAGVKIRVLHPRATEARLLDANEGSLIMELRHQDVGYLFTGDAGGLAERLMLEQGSLHAVSVLKVGHHGSRSSSSTPFLEALAPTLAVISVGRRNHYGMPHPELLRRFETRGIQVLRTDRHGAIRVTTDGQRLAVDTYGD